MGFCFANVPPPLDPHELRRRVVGAREKPPREKGMTRQLRGLPGEITENLLRDILREVRIAPNFAQRHRVDQIDPPSHQFGKRVFRLILDVLTEQEGVFDHNG